MKNIIKSAAHTRSTTHNIFDSDDYHAKIVNPARVIGKTVKEVYEARGRFICGDIDVADASFDNEKSKCADMRMVIDPITITVQDDVISISIAGNKAKKHTCLTLDIKNGQYEYKKRDGGAMVFGTKSGNIPEPASDASGNNDTESANVQVGRDGAVIKDGYSEAVFYSNAVEDLCLCFYYKGKFVLGYDTELVVYITDGVCIKGGTFARC